MEASDERSRSRLVPDETVQKFLISTTSRFIGDFEANGAAIRHAFPSFRSKVAGLRMAEGPISRSGFVLAFETKPYQKAPGVVVPTFDHIADAVCACLGVLYGKRFDNHGALEWDGIHWLPDLAAFGTVSLPDMPWNRHAPRVDVGIPLDLREFRRILPLLNHKMHDQAQTTAFTGAARFYLRALQAAEQDPEVAYLHLITAGEILANATHHDAEALLDDAAKGVLGRIEAEMRGGREAANLIRGRLLQVKRRFVATLAGLVDPAFFERTEARQEFATLKQETFRKVLGAAYDLRSRFVHSGVSFGNWIAPGRHHWLGEVQVGKPVVADKEMAKILAAAPTFIGLERVTRYGLLKLAAKLGADIDAVTPAASTS